MSICRTKRRTMAMVVIFALLTPGSVWAWGPLGHRVSAKLAESKLTPAARDAVRNLLEPGQRLADIATWVDEQRAKVAASWHYVEVPITEPRYSPKFCPPAGCVVSKIEDFKRVLLGRNAWRGQQQEALKCLVHFIQDLHQPLHVGDTGSHGGNSIQVRFFDSGSSLYEVWDSQVAEWHSKEETEWLKELDALATPEMVAEWSKGKVEDWATESLGEAKLAYRFPGRGLLITSGTKLDDDYCRFALPIIQRQLAKSGIRLAATLNAIFK